jgi:ABC-type uncharacterized transport system permease subunit
MNARDLQWLNVTILAAAGMLVARLALQPPFGGIVLALWFAAPFVVFVPLLALSSTATQHKCNLVALLAFSFLALLSAGSAVQPSDAFSGVVVWVVPVVHFMAATLACGVAAVAGRALSKSHADPAQT